MKQYQLTNELRNVNIAKIEQNPFMKPRKNPIHEDYADDSNNIFNVFSISESDFYTEKGHNIIYKTEKFTLRISKRTFPKDNNTDLQNFIDDQKQDETLMAKVAKKNISPQVYFIGNILYNNNLHRFYILQTYQFSLFQFIKNIPLREILNYGYYKNIEEVFDDISNQLYTLFVNLIKMKYIYYDIKPENAVININNNGSIILKLIDFDSEWCIQEEWIENNEETILFISILLMAYGCYYYLNNNIFYNLIRSKYKPSLIEPIKNILSDLNNEYNIILITYFWKSFNMTEKQKEEFDARDNDSKVAFLKKYAYFMLKYAFLKNNRDKYTFPIS